MSYRFWSTYGYGIDCESVGEPRIEKLMALLEMAPETKTAFDSWVEEEELDPSSITMEDVADYENDDNCWMGWPALLVAAMNELSRYRFSYVDDFEGCPYVLFVERMPWDMTEAEKGATKEDIEKELQRFISILTDKKVPVDYYTVENGG